MEFRVWIEDGTLLGYAVAYDFGRFEVEDAPKESGYLWPEQRFGSQAVAEAYARDWAEGLAEWARETCECDGTEECGVMFEHGISISIQEVES